jgi:hypothetical protein
MKNRLKWLIGIVIVMELFSCNGGDQGTGGTTTDGTTTPAASAIEVTVSPSTVPAGNSSTAAVTAIVRDADGNPLSGISLAIGSSGRNNRFSPDGLQTSNTNGQAVWSFRSITAEAKTITATVSGTSITSSATVSFEYASAAIHQPDGSAIPSVMGCSNLQPTGLAALFACQCVDAGICNIGVVCTGPSTCDTGVNSTCETTLWHAYNDDICIPTRISGLNPWTSASVSMQTFTPVGSLTFRLMSRGSTTFKNSFGWYNVTGSVPTSADLHEIIDCNASNGYEVTVNVLTDPAYLGGKIGFFMVTPESHTAHGSYASGNPNASVTRFASGEGYAYYAERAYNPDYSGIHSFYHLLVYESRVWNNKYYFAWEDKYGGSNNDFTDMVVNVSGIEY